jgi:hypothetical protein
MFKAVDAGTRACKATSKTCQVSHFTRNETVKLTCLEKASFWNPFLSQAPLPRERPKSRAQRESRVATSSMFQGRVPDAEISKFLYPFRCFTNLGVIVGQLAIPLQILDFGKSSHLRILQILQWWSLASPRWEFAKEPEVSAVLAVWGKCVLCSNCESEIDHIKDDMYWAFVQNRSELPRCLGTRFGTKAL